MNDGKKIAALGLLLCGTQLASPVHAEQTVSRDLSFTKRSTDFFVKNSFPLLPVTDATRIKRVHGTVFTITRKGEKAGEPISSETLFSLTIARNGHCPVDGEKQNDYSDIYNRYDSFGLGATILKQIQLGTKTFSFDYTFPVPLQVHAAQGSCLFMNFDGSDFANGEYTMGAHITVDYDTESEARSLTRSLLPTGTTAQKGQIAGLDAEFLVSVNNRDAPSLNAYVGIPIHQGGQIPPGSTILHVFGNATASSDPHRPFPLATTGKWNITHNILVYTKDSCQRAFHNHIPGKFMWNDLSGTASHPNMSSAFWTDAVKIGSVDLGGIGDQSTVGPAVAVPGRLPMVVHEGDCLVDAIIPSGDMTDPRPFNTESQVYVEYVAP
ncbi:hypothetical protein [Acetobacter estunensis]|uniref:hypothetical protein n=1 Tax=Acetobacter estunensis TaxID=104097 RepID=UPI001C2D2D3D|nr:hypothetical protein [Acetobacter estunensis]MBV1838620.1 hypothetical protein [Acetobacter estunensis]